MNWEVIRGFLAESTEAESTAAGAASAETASKEALETPTKTSKRPALEVLDGGKLDPPKKGKVLQLPPPKIQDLPMPSGGIGILLAIILFIVFAINQANPKTGESRLMLVWRSLMGAARIKTSADYQAQNQTSLTQSGVGSHQTSTPTVAQSILGDPTNILLQSGIQPIHPYLPGSDHLNAAMK